MREGLLIMRRSGLLAGLLAATVLLGSATVWAQTKQYNYEYSDEQLQAMETTLPVQPDNTDLILKIAHSYEERRQLLS